jgi:tetratricopeptide (TPR) repeat protein
MELGPDQTNPNDPTDDLSNEQRTILVTREQTRDRLEGLASGLSSQYDELEADIYGMFWASAAGYPVSAAYSMDSKMLAAEVDYFDHSGAEDGTINQGENPFGSHPTTPRRLQQLRNAEILLKQYHGLYTAGQELCEGGSSETGIAAYERYLQAFPSDSSAQTNVGLCLLDDLVDDCASSGMKEVLPRALDNRLVLRGPGDGSSPFDDPSWRASWTKARGAFETALSIDRRNHIALAGLGLMARHEHHDEEALLLLNQAVLLAPEADSQVAGIQNNRGTILAALGRNEEAKQAFAEATRVNPSMTIAWNNWRTVVASEGSKRRLKKFDKMRASSSTEIATEGAAGNPEITDFKGMRPGGSEESLFEAFGESDRTNPIQQFERQHLWQNLDAENYEGPGLDVYVRGDRVTSLVVDMRPVIDPEAWTLSNGLKAKMSREQVVQLMGLPGGGEFTGGGASFRLAYVYPEHGLRILFNDRWQVSQVMLVATQLESDSMDTYLAELEARIESSKAALDQVCLKLQGVYEKEDDYVSWCMDWMQENVVYDFEDADWGTYGTCIETVTNDDEVISCICDSQDEYWQCQDLAEDSEE